MEEIVSRLLGQDYKVLSRSKGGLNVGKTIMVGR